jgi:hypothetical protein
MGEQDVAGGAGGEARLARPGQTGGPGSQLSERAKVSGPEANYL